MAILRASASCVEFTRQSAFVTTFNGAPSLRCSKYKKSGAFLDTAYIGRRHCRCALFWQAVPDGSDQPIRRHGRLNQARVDHIRGPRRRSRSESIGPRRQSAPPKRKRRRRSATGADLPAQCRHAPVQVPLAGSRRQRLFLHGGHRRAQRRLQQPITERRLTARRRGSVVGQSFSGVEIVRRASESDSRNAARLCGRGSC